MDNKTPYEKAELKLILMDDVDVIRTSGPFDDNEGVMDDSWT